MTKRETKHMIMFLIAVLALFIFIVLILEQRESLLEVPAKPTRTVSVNYTYAKEALHEDKFVSDVYAGRYDVVKNAKYNSLGLPKGRYWMTSHEWHGKHIKSMKISRTKKRLLYTRFKSWKQNHIDAFINDMKDAAYEEHKVFPQIPASLIVAQAILETNFGLSKLAVEGNNFFGHKYRGSDADAYIVAADDSPTDRFTKYRSTWYSMRHHTKNVLMKIYYQRTNGDYSIDSWLNALCGAMTAEKSKVFVNKGNRVYATSCMTEVCYAQKLKRIIELYELE
jgi:hypothetical protein